MKRDGIYRKFDVRRTDGTDAHPGDKHFNCVYFVLDISHDKYAAAALLAYAEACGAELPELADDLCKMAQVNRLETGQDESPLGHFPPPCYAPVVKLAMESRLSKAEQEEIDHAVAMAAASKATLDRITGDQP